MSINNKWKSQLYKKAIELAMRRPAPNRIPLTDPERVRLRNYFTANLGDDVDRWRFLVRATSSKGVSGLWFADGQDEPSEASISNSELSNYKLQIKHYFAELELLYDSAIDFVFGRFSFGAWRRLCRERLTQFLFNKRTLVRHDRIRLLKRVVENTLENREYRTSSFGVMIELYGRRWVRHPEYESAHNYYRLMLESLAESGEMTRTELDSYRVAPKALTSLSRFEDEDRRYRAELAQQKYLGWLTVLLVIAGGIQALSTLIQVFNSSGK